MAKDENAEHDGHEDTSETAESSRQDTLERAAEEFGKLSRGFIYAGLESIAITANLARSFVDKTAERNDAEKRDSKTKQITSLPVDMTGAFLDVLDDSVDEIEKVVDKFREKYKEGSSE